MKLDAIMADHRSAAYAQELSLCTDRSYEYYIYTIKESRPPDVTVSCEVLKFPTPSKSIWLPEKKRPSDWGVFVRRWKKKESQALTLEEA